jgi:NAD+ kinase
MRVGVMANVYRLGIEAALQRLTRWGEADGHEILYEDTLNDLSAACDPLSSPEEIVAQAEMILAIGGDGTMLRAARLVRERGTPILGVNLGSLGFLTQVTPDELEAVLARLTAGDYHTEPRSVLAMSRPGEAEQFHALNEVAIDRGELARALELKLEAGDRLVCRYVADGLIIATPTGSTAYALSAGGPVAVPQLRAIIVAPVAAHTLTQRPVVFPDDEVLRVTCEEPNVAAAVTLDGRRTLTLKYGEACEVRRADFEIKLVRFPEQDFFRLVRTKLHWGIDPRHAHRDGHVD